MVLKQFWRVANNLMEKNLMETLFNKNDIASQVETLEYNLTNSNRQKFYRAISLFVDMTEETPIYEAICKLNNAEIEGLITQLNKYGFELV